MTTATSNKLTVTSDLASTARAARVWLLGVLLLLVVVVVLWCSAGVADARGLGVWWGVGGGARPSVLPEEGTGEVVVWAENLGYTGSSGLVRLVDRLPAGLEVLHGASAIKATAGGTGRYERGPVACSSEKQLKEGLPLECTFGVYKREKTEETVFESLPAFEVIEVRVKVRVRAGTRSGELNTVTVSGGGAPRAVAASRAIEIGETTHFGFEEYSLVPEDAGGLVDTQAGSHPFQLTSVVGFNTQQPNSEGPRSAALEKDVVSDLPAGLIGNPTSLPQCSDAQFTRGVLMEGQPTNECPASSAVGVATVTFNNPGVEGLDTASAPIFNMVPEPGEPARFGFKVLGLVSAFLDPSLRTGGDYGVRIGSYDTSEKAWLLSARLTFWGVPGDPRHNAQRGWECLQEIGVCATGSDTAPPPFLAMPTSCSTPFETTLTGDSWGSAEHPSETAQPVTYRLPEALDGCNDLPFQPEIRVTPDGTQASTPTGLNVDVHVPQEAVLNAEGLAQSAVEGITVALPAGVAVNPAGGDGLAACGETQVGYLPPPVSEPPGRLSFTATLPEPFCPTASKIATVDIKSPLLPKGQDVKGAAYLAAQNQNPFGSLIAMYLVAENKEAGVLIKQAGETRLTPSGQIIGTFKDVPQLAFEDAEVHFFGGERAPLTSPAHCSLYTTTGTFAPWSGNEPVTAESHFDITSGPQGTPCPGATLPFSPSLTAGTLNIQAGAYTPLTTTLSRPDGNQDLQSVQVRMPAGLEGILSNVKLCPETQANQGTCPPESQIGETTVSAGVGSDPVTVTGGKVYITEKYQGAPFGLSIVNPAKAGPFDLEHDTSNPSQTPACDCLVVRAKIEVDPRTAELTVTTDPTGPHAIPHLIDGVPVEIQHVNVNINRQNFTFNPTNCSPLQITATITGNEGATQPATVPFQAANCATLKFTPTLTATTKAQASKANGASVTFKLSYPPHSLGSQAWLKELKVDLPKQLPARLTTLQKACLAATFQANHAACPPASIIGHATVHTPLIPEPLTGPVYFVSYGAKKFPEAVIVLQGYGITTELHGETFINNKTGITSATFKTIPEVPFETAEVTIPTGPYSEFSANLPPKNKYNFCGQTLNMPTQLTATNNTQTHTTTKITIQGCKPKHTHHTKTHKHK